MVTSTSSENVIRILDVTDDEYNLIVAALDHAGGQIRRDGDAVQFPRKITNLSWPAYLRLLEALGDHRLRHVYAEGELKMSPRKDHDWVGRFLGRIVQAITFELDLPIQCIGSTTITSGDLNRGFEPDEAYYLVNEPTVRGKRLFEPDVDPPPDLIIEIDVTRNSEDRLASFAVMGVPEVWRHEDDSTVIYWLNESGHYDVSQRSRSFPFLADADLDRFVAMINDVSENDVVREVIEFVRKSSKQKDEDN